MSKVFKKVKKAVKKVSKSVKKVVSKVGKVIKKAAPALIGGALGFMVGGPMGAVKGAMAGYGAGKGYEAGGLTGALAGGMAGYGLASMGVGAYQAGSAGFTTGGWGGALKGTGKYMGGQMFGGGTPQNPMQSGWGAPGGFSTPGFGGGGSMSPWQMAMGGLDAYQSIQQGNATAKDMNAAVAAANPFAKERQGYADKLKKLYEDPNSITETSRYKFQFDQGMKALNRTSAMKGDRLGGRALIEAQEFGQNLATTSFSDEVKNLSVLSGATMGFGAEGSYGYNGAVVGGQQEAAGTMGGVFGYGSA